jgi:O-antigen/teichoic acid export membrane protein
MSSPVFNFIYKFLERAGSQVISIIVTIILARLLEVSDFGAIEIVTVIVSICQIFVQSGLNSALIQKKDVTQEDFSVTFFVNTAIAFFLYIILFVLSPSIEKFYAIDGLTNYIRVTGLVLLPCSMMSIQYALLAKSFQFRKQMICSVLSMILGAVVGIVMAYKGLGIWSFVAYQIVTYWSSPLIALIVVRWMPSHIDSFKRIVPLFKFGIRILIASFIDNIYNDITSLIIGKKFTPSQLALYGKGKQFPQALITSVNGSIQSVAFPYLAKHQDSRNEMKDRLSGLIKMSSFVVFPIMFGLIACAKPFVLTILTEKWIMAVPYIQLMCIVFVAWPIFTANAWVLNAIGRSDLYLKTEIIKKVINFVSLVLCVVLFDSISAIIIGQIVVIPINVAINMVVNKRIIGYSVKELLSDIASPLLLSVIMGVIVYQFQIISNFYIALIVQVLVGVSVYLIFNVFSRNRNYRMFKGLVKDALKR